MMSNLVEFVGLDGTLSDSLAEWYDKFGIESWFMVDPDLLVGDLKLSSINPTETKFVLCCVGALFFLGEGVFCLFGEAFLSSALRFLSSALAFFSSSLRIFSASFSSFMASYSWIVGLSSENISFKTHTKADVESGEGSVLILVSFPVNSKYEATLAPINCMSAQMPS
ncbi:hypothetical protein WICPIJ_000173 [Wickerhamomyces pijperi]|uniref:Uncharacterized protein n=1 Tax=Wickerhamomyces pijperi TaxID=599730 RepID=A0A9P8QEB0_WICPI|nr:hypothetical protein WICPIJ_000173 [Wickerhamomyces pijperi]